MRFASARALAVAGTLLAGISSVQGQVVPNVVRQGSPQRETQVAPPLPTVMRPTEGEIVAGDLAIAVQVPPQVPARMYTIEAAYWDPARNNWFYPGTLGSDFKGGTTATTRVAADVRQKLNATATRWKIHVRVSDPPGGWGPWREFIWQAASPGATAAATEATPVTVPTDTATLPAGQGTKPGIMVPGTAGQNPGTPELKIPPNAPGTAGTTLTQPPSRTPPSAGLPAVQQPPTEAPSATPPSAGLPAVQQPPSRTPPSASLPAVQQPPAQPPSRTPPSAGLPAVQQPPAQPPSATPPSASLPAVQQPPAQPPSATPPSAGLPAVQQPPAQPPSATPPSASLPTVQQPPPPPQSPPPPPKTAGTATTNQPALPATGAIKLGAQKTPPSLQTSPSSGGNPVNVASRTALQVWDGKPMLDSQRIFVPGPVDVDWGRTPLPWWFQVTTTAPTAVVVKGRWEMSRTGFGDWGAWTPLPGIGYTGPVDSSRFVIALDPFAPRPPDWPVKVSLAGQLAPVAQAKGGGGGSGSISTLPPQFAQASSLPPDLRIQQPGQTGQAGKVPAFPSILPVSLSLYVRVVLVDTNGKDADLPSNAVELRFGPPKTAPTFNMDPKYWPVVTFVSYRPVQGYTFDWQCWVKAAKDIKTTDPFSNASVILFHAGDTRSTCDSSSSILDDFVDALGGFVDILKSFINWVSNAYSSIKEFAVSKLVSVIPGCSDSPPCQFAVQAGLNTGLAALGMPPDLPDFDQLQAMGEGYLVDAIAQQVAAKTNLPFAEEATKAALQEMIDKGKQTLHGGGSGSSAWIPDDSKQYKPLFATFAVTNPSATHPTPAMYLELSEPGGSTYTPTTVAVPGLAPGKSVKVSIALKPVKDPKAWMGLLPTQKDYGNVGVWFQKMESAKKALQNWRTAYLTGAVKLRATLKLPPFVEKTVYESSFPAGKPVAGK